MQGDKPSTMLVWFYKEVSLATNSCKQMCEIATTVPVASLASSVNNKMIHIPNGK